MRSARQQGFTVYEFLVSTLVVSVVLLATMLITSQMGSQLRKEKSRVSGADNARVALDEVTRILRAAGSQADMAFGQRRFVYAGPWTLGMNANLFPLGDEDPDASPGALDPALNDGTVLFDAAYSYVPPRAFDTGAETIVLTVDTNRDGLVDVADAADDEEEESSNPHDLVLKSYVYGSNGANNTVTATGLALLRGPDADEDGMVPQPLFRYWVDDDNDPDTASVLHGDTDGDGELSQSEIAALTPVNQDDLALITRVDVTATTEGETEKSQADWTTLGSSVSFRNLQTTRARVSGIVFNDANENGVRDSGEVPLPGVVVRCSNGKVTKTNSGGRYNFMLAPGTYAITEIDDVGYRSTTANTVSIDPIPGDFVEVHFGDVFAAGTGFIHGIVFHDVGRNGLDDKDQDWGMPGIRIFLDTGASTTTDSVGKFLFVVATGNYTVTEVDSAGYASSTPNIKEVTVAGPGDSVFVSFGDYPLKSWGEIHGIVYLDANKNGILDRGEAGIPNVTITLDESNVTVTDAAGAFEFVAGVGSHTLTETDPPDHTSSTLNTISVDVAENQITNVEFGDIGKQDVSFQEIVLSETERALSIAAPDFKEDTRADLDMVLGTHYVGGTNDILVWWNARKNATTPNSALFSLSPDHQRVISADVNAVITPDLNRDGAADVINGLGTAENNICVWMTQTQTGFEGQLPTSPTQRYTASLAMSVNDIVSGDFDGDAYLDLAVGTTTGLGTGKLEIWHGHGGDSFSREDSDIYTSVQRWDDSGSLVTETLGEVVSLAKADFNRDGVDDLVLASRAATSVSQVYLLVFGADLGTGVISTDSLIVIDPSLSSKYANAVQRITVYGDVQDVLAVDMMEDDLGDVDLVIGAGLTTTSGVVQVWHNRGGYQFGAGSVGTVSPSDQVNPGGVPLSLAAATMDNDIFPDLLVGTRMSAAYDGQVVLYRAFGYLPTSGTVISSTGSGEVVTMTTADFNKDGAPDLATGTRTSVSTGKVVVFFNERQGI